MSRSLVGTRIRERRRAKKISQTALAKQVGISPSYLNLIEHNRRGIAGKTLLALARKLDLNPRHLTEGADQGLVDRIRKAGAKTPGSEAEIQRTEELIGRFPGFAQLIEILFDQVEMQDQTVQALSDKMSNDPFFAEAMHLMLSSITVIRSTSDILAQGDELPGELRARFLSNLTKESERLSETAQKVLRHFEPASQAPGRESDARSVDQFLEARDYYLPEFEVGEGAGAVAVSGDADGCSDEETTEAVDRLIAKLSIASVDQARARRTLTRYKEMAALLPIGAFVERAREFNFDPFPLAAHYKVELPVIFWRLAHLGAGEDLPRFGLMECDGSGAVLFRKALTNFSLPRYSSACPLWPVYASLSQPQQPIRAMMQMPNRERFLCYAVSYFHMPGRPGLPGQLRAAMLFTHDHGRLISREESRLIAEVEVGFQCSVCPRAGCAARRNGYLLEGELSS